MRPWLAFHSKTRPVRRSGFNGATALRPWLADKATGFAAGGEALQWGHGLAAVVGQ